MSTENKSQMPAATEGCAAAAGYVSDEPQAIRCGTLLCGNLAVWRRPITWGGKTEGWHRKCQRCFDAAGEDQERWSRVLQPSHTLQRRRGGLRMETKLTAERRRSCRVWFCLPFEFRTTMKTNLTPGYWKADYNCTSLVYTDEAEIAHVEESNDARAISAVPELIDALYEALRAGIMSAPAYEQAKRALAKALGPDWQNANSPHAGEKGNDHE